jgi:AcrR family transcriptional regulator
VTTAAKKRAASKKPLVRGEVVVRGVLRAALEELAQHGYRGMRIEDVAVRAGVNKTSVYRRWPSKDELIRDALLGVVEAGFYATPPDTGSLRGDLLEMARRGQQLLRTPEGRGVLRVLLADGADPVVSGLARSIQKAREALPRSIIEGAIARGELPEGVDGEMVIEVIRAVVRDRQFIQDLKADEAFLDRLLDLVLHGALAVRTARHRNS